MPFQPQYWLEYAALALLVSAVGSGLSIQTAPRPFKIVFRTIVASFTVYLALHAPVILDTGHLDTGTQRIILTYGRWAAVLCGGIALFRPSFAFFTLLYVYWQKLTLQSAAGLWITPLDFIAVLEVGLFLVLCFVARGLTQRFMTTDTSEPRNSAISFLEAALLVAIALHFGNYFYSGLEKLIIGDAPLTWVLENKTNRLLLAAFETGQLPISSPEWLAALTFDIMERGNIPLNAIVLVTQLFSLIAITRVRLLVLLTIFYDLVHVVIFLTTGIFFWKWILLNLAIVFAACQMRHVVIPKAFAAFLMAVILVSPQLVQIAKLAWFDTSAVNAPSIEAVTSNGEAYRVPTNYFGPLSVVFAQHRAGWPFSGHFATGTYGATSDPKVMRQGNQCALATGQQSDLERSTGRQALATMIRAFHANMLEQNPDGQPPYDLYPHHIWANPIEFREFAALDKRQISHYRLVVESVCISVNDEHIVRDIKLRGQYDIPLR